MTNEDLTRPSFRISAPKGTRRIVPRGTSVLDVPIGSERRVPDTVLRVLRPEDSITGLPPPSMAQRHGEALSRYLTPKIGGPRAQAVAQTLLTGGPESALPFGIGLQELVPFSPYVAEEAGSMIAEGVHEGSPLTVGLGLGLGALQASPAIGPLSRGAVGVAKRAVQAADPEAIRQYVRGTQGLTGLPGAAVIKPKGGNWIANAGSPEEMTRPLKSGLDTPWIGTPEEIAQRHADLLRNLRATVNTPEGNEQIDRMLANDQILSTERALHRAKTNIAINDWIDKKLTKYIRNEMATPDDPVRKLIQEKGISHLPEEDLLREGSWSSENTMTMRRNRGFPEEGLALKQHEEAGYPAGLPEERTRMAKGWEDLTDPLITQLEAGDYLNPKLVGEGVDAMYLRENPWLAKVDPQSPVYSAGSPRGYPISVTNNDLGFTHLVDELKNAMSLRSELPPSLRIDPDDLKKMSMAQAVERVAKINEWRADAAKQAQLEAQKNVDIFREYPTVPGTEVKNESGLRWAQLNKPGQFKYESDHMGHSVRGYEPVEQGGSASYGLGGWEAIQSGKAKVYSLRNAKGEPHVTIEVGKLEEDDLASFLTRNYPGGLGKAAADYAAVQESGVSWDEFMRQTFGSEPMMITQIKGKQNRAPKEEYLPFIQDFVRSQQWGEVRDLRNAGFDLTANDLFDAGDMATFSRAGIKVPQFMTRDEARAMSDKLYEIRYGNNPETGLPLGGQ